MATKPADIDGYLSALPDGARAVIEELRRIIKAVAPTAVEGISYDMPAFTYRGRRLLYFGAWKDHCALYGLSVEGHQSELAPYDASKGTIRFPLGQPLPEALVNTLVTERVAEIEAAAGSKRKKSGSR